MSAPRDIPELDAASLEHLEAIARRAGEAILAHYRAEQPAELKADRSPITAADRAAHTVITEALAAWTPEVPVVSEEGALPHAQVRQAWRRFWLVDPLDGTKEFISRNDEFTVNIALVEDGEPTLGVVLAPALGRLFAGAVGIGAWVEDAAGRRPIRCRAVPKEGFTVVASRSHGDAAALEAYLGGRKVAAVRSAGSSLKLCVLAAGEADLYPRLGRTMEWDIAAGHAVLAAAGGSVTELSGTPLRYGKPGFENPHFVAQGLAD